MKKALALILILTTLLPFVIGCSSKASDGKDKEEPADSQTESEQEENEPSYTTQKEVGNPSAIGATAQKGDTLPSISINVANSEEITSKYYYLQATVSVENCPEQYQLENVAAEVRKRGNGTYGWEKGAYRIRFQEKYNLFGQANGYGRSWVLLSNMSDEGMLRTHAVFAMAQRLEHISWTTSSSFVHLYVNGRYRGVYQLVEQHNTSDGRIVVNEDLENVDSDYLIELDKYASQDGIYGTDWFRLGSFSYSGGTGTGVRDIDYLIRSDYNTKERCKFVEEYFKKADSAILDGSYEEVSKYIDLDSFIDMYILQELSRNGDVGWSSFYMVKKAGDKIYFTCPWDFDLAFGNDSRIHNNSYKYLFAGNGVQREKQSHRWYYLMFKQKWFVDMVAERWNEVACDMRDLAVNEIDRIHTYFYDDFMKNYTVWSMPVASYDADFNPAIYNDSQTEHVLFLKYYLCCRFDWLDNYFNSDQKYEQIGTPVD